MAADQHLQPGHLVDGKYELTRLIGEGAMGMVFEAKNAWTRRRVALKTLPRELAKVADLAERFVQEGRSAAMVAHPNVVEVLDMGRDAAHGTLYIVQELLTGSTVEALLARRGRLPTRDALDILVPVMGGLAAAHRRGVVHRDVKPANIVLAQTPAGNLVPKLIDFGIAKLLGEGPGKTLPGVLVGSPCYMSPEQLLGAADLDQRTDVWAAGIVLYELLAGRRPFDGSSVGEVCVAVGRGQFAPLRSHAPEVPEGLVRALYGALAPKREDRHPSMEVFLEALLSAPDLRDISAWLVDRHSDSLPYRRRHPRQEAHLAFELSCPKWSHVAELVSQDVSRGGVFLLTTRPPEVGTRVELGLVLPDGSRLRLGGQVVRAVTVEQARGGNAGIGVKFDDEHATQLAVLEQVASAHQSQGYAPLPASQAPAPAAPQTHADAPRAKGVKPAPAAPKRLAEAVGIDFGTTFSSVSVAYGDQVYAVPDVKQRTLHPSIVSFPKQGQPVVGWDARMRHVQDPERTVRSVKRLMGRSFDDPTLQGYLASLPYHVVRGPGDSCVVQLDQEPLAPAQIAAQVVDLLRRVVEGRTGKGLKKAVLSVPMAFGATQRQAVERAAKMAGLEVLELVGEPIAALLAYGVGQQRREVVAVYDFGGGTFDFSVVELAADEHRVLASGGDSWLGGDDLDLAIASAAADRFWRETRVDLRQRAVEWQRLLYAAEHAKRVLTAQDRTELVVERALDHPTPRDLRWLITREDFEGLCRPVAEASLDVCRDALTVAGLAAQRVDRVVLTGGTSRIPLIQREVAQFFGKPVTALADPELSVCVGAGLRAAMLTGHPVKAAAHRG